MTDRDAIYATLRRLLRELFEIDPAQVTPETTFQELDIDSIDAVDLVVHLHDLIGKRIPPDDFRQIRTVGDVVEVVQRLTAE
ncbi:acyl carrier protein [Methylomarinovum tepidoasis]|uniref:Acyl carrier protein n=2 Tax=Methylomarinovum tepidoasis TaxID=2840183 RepID=A0AAU9CTV7_9GAMM|nr:acyl carrier protein [Methylomarinovum sp. IN45]